jgi:hypothetical protein
VGCGVVVVLVIGLVVAFGLWIRSPGELLEPQRLLGADTTGYVEWTLRLEDPGTEGFARRLIETIQKLPPEGTDEMPEWLGGWITQRQNEEAQEDILKMFPLVAAWTLHPGTTPEEDLHLASVSVERLGHQLIFADWVLGLVLSRSDRVEVERYRGEKVYRIPIDKQTTLAVFLRDGHLFFTSNLDSARTAVDRLIEAAGNRAEPSELDRWFAETADDPLRGAVTNRRGELLRLWRSRMGQRGQTASLSASDRSLWRELRGLSLSGGLRDDGSFAGTLRFHCPDPDWASAHLQPLTVALQALPDLQELSLETQTGIVGDRIEVDFRVPDLAPLLSRIAGPWKFEDGSRTIRIDF